ncbi:hypothetical protein [Roseateles violae]|uniref:Lipoprotein n=1 Tax=Roseateles violae TaxID=3058042 RepID=A0ABT8DTK5_9BURK|nr:hypothetical protein [Pelomonas sp. PFR6]MDN3919649.1 hypothetical protein [Pelomonas sp. PFR6]
MLRMSTGLIALVLTQIVGCASIVNGQNQSVSVDARSDAGVLAGANCTLSNNKGTWYVSTPGTVTVQRSFEDMAVKCEKTAYEPGLATFKSSTKAMAFGNIIFGGVIGAGVDVATGAAYDYPAVLTVMMAKAGQAAPAPAAAASDAQPTTTAAAASPTAVK